MTDRRRFLGYLLAAPTVAAAAYFGEGATAPKAAATAPAAPSGVVPSNPQPADVYDLEDMLTDAAKPTTYLVQVEVKTDGTVSYALPRAEVGQGITTAIAMLIAEEMDLPVEKVQVPLSDARPELVYNQFTGGTNTINSLYTPVRVAAAIAKGRLMEAAAHELDAARDQLTSRLGVIEAPDGSSVSYGELAERAASPETKQVETELKPESEFKIVGKPHRRVDALDIVTGRKTFTTDMQVSGAKPCMLCRPPTINGKARSVRNLAAVKSMPGITDVVPVSTGIAVRGETFGQCIDAVRALQVDWGPGPKDSESDESIGGELKAATLPMVLEPTPGNKVFEADFTFAWAGNSALETNCAVADVRKDRAEIWSPFKVPIAAQYEIAKKLGLPQTAVTLHVMTGGGSFGRRLFYDGAIEAAEASQKTGKPVKLMWHRADDARQGRAHPMAYSRIRATYGPEGVTGYQQNYTSVRTDLSHGLGDTIGAATSRSTSGGQSLSATLFEVTQTSPYNFGVTKQLITETHQSHQDNQLNGGFNTGSMRSVYSQNVVCAQELFVDMLAQQMGLDPYEFRHKFVRSDKFRTVLEKVGEHWNPNLPKGFGQGFGLHKEHKQVMACLVEIDARPETVNREVRDGVTGPRVTRAWFATIPGKVVVNPLGMEAQIQGGFIDGLSLALTSSMHLTDGHFLEASWDNYAYTRQWNVPKEKIHVYILPPDTEEKPAGAGEMAVSPSKAAVACAYARAIGQTPDFWPVQHHKPLYFDPYPTEPPLPASPSDGLERY